MPKKGKTNTNDNPTPSSRFLTQLVKRNHGRTEVRFIRNIRNTHRATGASSGVPNVDFFYVVGVRRTQVALWISSRNKETNKVIYDTLDRNKAKIEVAFGKELTWDRLDTAKGSRISSWMESGGCSSPENTWPQLQDEMIDAMVRFEKALMPHLEQMPGYRIPRNRR